MEKISLIYFLHIFVLEFDVWMNNLNSVVTVLSTTKKMKSSNSSIIRSEISGSAETRHSWLTNTCRQAKWLPQLSILLLLSALSSLWSLDKATGFLRMIDQSAVGADLPSPVDNLQTNQFSLLKNCRRQTIQHKIVFLSLETISPIYFQHICRKHLRLVRLIVFW